MDYKAKAKELVNQMTLEEKASLCSGKDFWHLKAISRLGLEEIMVSDGPHGLRKVAAEQSLGLVQSIPATSFPTACTTACSFDRELLERMGEALGEKCNKENVSVILGPGANIKRSPLCGRNFEYFSEDPYLTGEMAAALINGVQSRNVGTSLKHFAANNQETGRMSIDSVVDERALYEIYLTGFEKAVKQAKPWTIMCSYNKVNGTYSSDNKYLLTDILRDKWGYEGLVMSDWGATDDRAQGIRAGMDLEMPGSSDANDAQIVEAVKNGTLTMDELDLSALRLTELILHGMDKKSEPEHTDKDRHVLAHEIATKSAVLLKNTDSLLPLTKDKKIAVIGEMAKNPRYQGAGSSRINPFILDNALEAFQENGISFDYADGYSIKNMVVDQAKIDEACRVAKNCDVAVVFVGLTDEYESEGFDRTSLSMPENHDQLVQAVANVNPNTIVVLQCGSPVTMPWKDQVKGILLSYLAGEASGTATVDLLYGKVNPSGKLAETFPLALEDNSSAAYFPGEPKAVQYRESIYVGYRYYDTVGMEVAYPFGHGLSYTTFEYSNLEVKSIGQYDYKVTATITNTGNVAGAETVQLYIQCKDSSIFRAKKELKAFDKIYLNPGESKTVSFLLDQRSFAYYNAKVSDWCVEGGSYEILLAASCSDVRLNADLTLQGDGKEELLAEDYKSLTDYFKPSTPLKISDQQFEHLLGYKPPTGYRLPDEPFDINSTFHDIKDTLVGAFLTKAAMNAIQKSVGNNDDPTMLTMMERSVMDMPLRCLRMIVNPSISNKRILEYLEMEKELNS